MKSDTWDLVLQNILSDERPLFSLSFTSVSSAVIHYTVHLHLQSFCHALLLKEMERNPLDTSLAFFYQQASNSLIKSFPINYKLIVYKHFNTIFQMIINKLWLVKRSDKDGGTGRGKGRGREVKQSRLIGLVVFINVDWHWVMGEFQKPQNPKNA